MITIKVNEGSDFVLDINSKQLTVNGNVIDSDWVQIDKNKFHVIANNISYNIELLAKSDNGKQLTLVVNGQKYTVDVRDKYDELLTQLGMDKLTTVKVNEIKAPMPGLVLRLLVTEGQAIKKGDALLVLEAMKMENIIKATGEGIVKTIKVQPKLAVEKNQVMLIME